MAQSTPAIIAIPLSISISAIYPSQAFENFIGSGKQSEYRLVMLPKEIENAILAERISEYIAKELNQTPVSYGRGLPPDVEDLIQNLDLESAFQASTSEIIKHYSTIKELKYETLEDADSEDRWVVIGINADMPPSEKQKAYDNFLSSWIDLVDASKRSFIRIEHINA